MTLKMIAAVVPNSNTSIDDVSSAGSTAQIMRDPLRDVGLVSIRVSRIAQLLKLYRCPVLVREQARGHRERFQLNDIAYHPASEGSRHGVIPLLAPVRMHGSARMMADRARRQYVSSDASSPVEQVI